MMTNHSVPGGQPSFREVWLFVWQRLGSVNVYIFALFLGFSQTFIMMLFPLIDNLYFDILERRQFESVQLLLLISTVVILLLLFFVMAGEYLKKTITTQLDVDVSAELSDHAQRLPLETAQGTHSSDLVQRVTHDARRAAGFLPLIADELANQIVMFLLALVYIMWLNWQVGAVLLVISPLLLTASHVLRKKVSHIGKQIAEQESVVRTCQQEALQHIELVQAYSIGKWMEERYLEARNKLNRMYMTRFLWQQLSGFASSTSIELMVIGTMVTVGLMALKGTMTIGALVAFSTLVWRLNSPLKSVASLWTRAQGEIGGTTRVFALLHEEKEPLVIEKPSSGMMTDNSILMRRVQFAYKEKAGIQGSGDSKSNSGQLSVESQPKLLEDFTLNIAEGSFIAIVGPSGSGKSTIAQIAAGLLLPPEGDVMICGRDVRLDAEWARANIAYVPQQPFLFDGSVRDNLQMVNPGASNGQIEQAARLALAQSFIKDLPDQYDTDLKEHGNSLSGGQKQRLAIARAVVADRLVWILDEPTSALDVDTEEKVMNNLVQHARRHRKTMMVVEHRLTTVRQADEIIVLQSGRIVQRGTHEELTKKEKGLYWQMWLNNQ